MGFCYRKTIFLFGLMGLVSSPLLAQYKDNPLKDKRWATLGVGLNTADNISWQALGTLSSRGEIFLSQLRVGYSQEFIEASTDVFTFRKNRLAEISYMLGDGWAGKYWYAMGAMGFGINMRMYADSGTYQLNYITAVSPGIPAQLEAGVMFNKKWGAGIMVVGNLNFRQSYYGLLIGTRYQFK